MTSCCTPVFSSLLALHCPHFFDTLLRFDLEPPMYLPEWLMPLWTRSLDPEVAAHLLHLIALEGDGILIHAALAVCAAIEPVVVTASEMPACRKLLSEAPAGISVDLFCEMLQRCPVSNDDLAPLRRPPAPKPIC